MYVHHCYITIIVIIFDYYLLLLLLLVLVIISVITIILYVYIYISRPETCISMGRATASLLPHLSDPSRSPHRWGAAS